MNSRATTTRLGYPVHVGAGVLDEIGEVVASRAPAHAVVVVTDDHVSLHWLAPAMNALAGAAPRLLALTVPAGEAYKTRTQWAALTDQMLEHGCGRDTTIVALGGGVVGDLAGFVAATFMRGIPVVQVPTTLLAMVDASIGGKTGVDTSAGKNLVGAFHQPSAVLADPTVLATLPPRELRGGMAEVLKHGAIADAAYFERAAAWCAETSARLARGDGVDWWGRVVEDLVARSVAIKSDVVHADPREGGRRQVLNAGHTVAHAIERVSEYRVSHGEAVAIGLVAEALLAERLGVAEAGTADRLRSAVDGAGLPFAIPTGMQAETLLSAMRTDKKGRGGRLAFSLLATIGSPSGSDDRGWASLVDDRAVLDAMRAAGAG